MMSFTSSSSKLGSMITPPMRPRISIVRGQDSAPYWIALPWGRAERGPVGMDRRLVRDPSSRRAGSPSRRVPEQLMPSARIARRNLSRRSRVPHVEEDGRRPDRPPGPATSASSVRAGRRCLRGPSGVGPQGRADGLELLHLALQHRAGEFVHAEVAGGEGRQQAAPELLGVGRADRADVVETDGAFEQLRVVVVTAPPSPEVIVLLSWKLLMPMSPIVPTNFPL